MSDLAAEKKRAEVYADEYWVELQDSAKDFFRGGVTLNDFHAKWLCFQQAHNIERGLRHESED